MAQITFEYDAHNIVARKFIDLMLSMNNLFMVKEKEEQVYNEKFVEKILESREQARQGKVRKVEIEDLWK
jgi:hypothetical protein